ncbi:ATP-binding cassette domain-containing protein [Arthrobacter sp. H35-D1]|uniref:ATP-binding cassette domain-containing protein n=1 Tax=Arthrobacter sp. H35-D1 TaxID=3046202 RepID=UPI0024B9AABE|nr:ATP-binding cassette domain-containing protein [Arthrobacter sp. H35-D1]MDJ0312554.1 ATP-binding cassette domain-containing protein [Arthrobacter sp. H35-D1]
MSAPLLQVSNLVTEFPVKGWRKPPVRVLKNVNLDVKAGETVGLVGESGSGKTTIGRAVLGLAPVTEGTVTFNGQDISHLSGEGRRKVSKDIQVVFQDPYTSLNPAMTIADILSEPLIVQGMDKLAAQAKVGRLLDRVHLPGDAATRLPREFSGGQRQRVAIARALAMEPKLIVCDEPVSALDLSTQARVLDLFLELQEQTGVAYLFISHDLAVVRHLSHRVCVLYRGEVKEFGDAADVTENPKNDYTRRLLMASPIADPARQRQRREERHALAAQA